MEEQNNNSAPAEELLLPAPEKKSKYWKFVLGFLAIITVAVGGYLIWENYFSPQAKLDRQNQENYQKFLDWQKNYEDAMRADIYGGKTPEETLKMFIDALKKGDMGLASKYFKLEDDGNQAVEILDNLKKAQEENKLQFIIDTASSAKFDKEASSVDNVWFTVLNKDGMAAYTIIFELNKYANIWKIESM